MMKYDLRSRSKDYPPDTEKVFGRENLKQERGTSSPRRRQRRRVQRLANSAKIPFAENAPLREQNQTSATTSNEFKARRSSRLLEKANMMSYEDIVEARAKGAVKGAIKGKGKRDRRRMCAALEVVEPELGLETKPEMVRMTAPVAPMYPGAN
ncbi:hypothetical protein O988_05875 [Pseudogymnoascus sp. VKM F-3808]|nr:hypothetical protein O988_05875 [Pseudogymnoascus sp. VKM F-3808]